MKNCEREPLFVFHRNVVSGKKAQHKLDTSLLGIHFGEEATECVRKENETNRNSSHNDRLPASCMHIVTVMDRD